MITSIRFSQYRNRRKKSLVQAKSDNEGEERRGGALRGVASEIHNAKNLIQSTVADTSCACQLRRKRLRCLNLPPLSASLPSLIMYTSSRSLADFLNRKGNHSTNCRIKKALAGKHHLVSLVWKQLRHSSASYCHTIFFLLALGRMATSRFLGSSTPCFRAKR